MPKRTKEEEEMAARKRLKRDRLRAPVTGGVILPTCRETTQMAECEELSGHPLHCVWEDDKCTRRVPVGGDDDSEINVEIKTESINGGVQLGTHTVRRSDIVIDTFEALLDRKLRPWDKIEMSSDSPFRFPTHLYLENLDESFAANGVEDGALLIFKNERTTAKEIFHQMRQTNDKAERQGREAARQIDLRDPYLIWYDVDLSDCGLEYLPKDFGHVVIRGNLDLSSNALTELPENFGCLTLLSPKRWSPDDIVHHLDLSGNSELRSLRHIGGCGRGLKLGLNESLWGLNLAGCTSLVTLPNEIGGLRNLRVLNLRDCYKLASLPDRFGECKALKTLDLGGCTKLASLPDSIGDLTSLTKLYLIECESLKSLPDSIGNLKALTELNLYGCKSLVSLPERFGECKALKTLWMSGCSKLVSLPDSIGDLKALQTLNLESCEKLVSLPERIGDLTSLTELTLTWCENLTSLPERIGDLTSLTELDLSLCWRLASLPERIGDLTSLTELNLENCEKLVPLPKRFGDCKSLTSLNLRACKRLVSLPDSIGQLTNLQTLNLSGSYSNPMKLESLPNSIGDLTSLTELKLAGCINLTSLPERIGDLKSLTKLDLEYCFKLVSLPERFGECKALKTLNLGHCFELVSLPDSIGNLTKLEKLWLNKCESLVSLPDSIGDLKSLTVLNLFQCGNLVSLPKRIGNLTNLEDLDISECKLLTSLPSGFERLTSLDLPSFEAAVKHVDALPQGITQHPHLRRNEELLASIRHKLPKKTLLNTSNADHFVSCLSPQHITYYIPEEELANPSYCEWTGAHDDSGHGGRCGQLMLVRLPGNEGGETWYLTVPLARRIREAAQSLETTEYSDDYVRVLKVRRREQVSIGHSRQEFGEGDSHGNTAGHVFDVDDMPWCPPRSSMEEGCEINLATQYPWESDEPVVQLHYLKPRN